MSFPEPSIARQALLDVAGPAGYKRFLAELNGRCQSKKRLFYWQESLWDQVQARLGRQIADFETIAGLFRQCHVHTSELERQVVPVVYGTFQLTGSHIEAMEASFPYANEVFLGPCWHEPPTHREIFYCPDCRTAKQRWEALKFT